MDDKLRAEIRETTQSAKPKIGHRDCGIVDARCADCGELLMQFQITKSNDDLTKEGKRTVTTTVRVKCGLCGGESYNCKIGGVFFAGAAADNICIDIADDEVEDVDVVYKACLK